MIHRRNGVRRRNEGFKLATACLFVLFCLFVCFFKLIYDELSIVFIMDVRRHVSHGWKDGWMDGWMDE